MMVSTSAQLNLKPQKLYRPRSGRYSFGSGFLIMSRYLKSSLRKLLQQEHETS